MNRSLVVALFLGSVLSTAVSAQISTPKARGEVVAAGEKLAVRDQARAARVEVAVDPLHPPAANLRWEVDPAVKTETPQRNATEVVKLLAANIHPTGSITLGGEPYLLFTERRQKIGDNLSVALDGVEYNVEIVSITPTRFRIRYNGQEAERTIK